MSDIFVSYKCEEVATALKLRSALRGDGYSVYWDQNLQCGKQWADQLDRELLGAKVVVVLWSVASTASDWVKHEASVAKSRGVLVPAKIDACTLPPSLAAVQASDLVGWNGSEDDPGYRKLVSAIRAILMQSRLRRIRNLLLWALPVLALGAGIVFSLSTLRTSGASEPSHSSESEEPIAGDRLENLLLFGSGSVYEQLSSMSLQFDGARFLKPMSPDSSTPVNVTRQSDTLVIAVDNGTRPGLQLLSDATERAADIPAPFAPMMAMAARSPCDFPGVFASPDIKYYAVRIDRGDDTFQVVFGRTRNTADSAQFPTCFGDEPQPSANTQAQLELNVVESCISWCSNHPDCEIRLPSEDSGTLSYLDAFVPSLATLRQSEGPSKFIYRDLHREWPSGDKHWIALGSRELHGPPLQVESQRAVHRYSIAVYNFQLSNGRRTKPHFLVGAFSTCGSTCAVSNGECSFLARLRERMLGAQGFEAASSALAPFEECAVSLSAVPRCTAPQNVYVFGDTGE